MTIKLNELPTEEQIDEAANQRIQRRRDTGRRLMQIGQQLRDAQRAVEELTKQYSAAYKDATDDAWTPNELAATGLPTPAVQRPRPRPRKRVNASRTTRAMGTLQEPADDQ